MPDEKLDSSSPGLPKPINTGDIASLPSIKPMDKPHPRIQPAFVMELDHMVSGLPLDLREWAEQIRKIEEFGNQLVSEEEKALFSSHLINAALDKVLENADHFKTYSATLFAVLPNIVKIAAKMDKMAAQEAAAKRQHSYKTTFYQRNPFADAW